MPTPTPPVCLTRPYSAIPGQRGGTLIAEDVVDLDEHARRMPDPDAYRPERCHNCDHDRLHAHDRRDRKLRGQVAKVWFRRYRCAACRAVWLVLAAFIARHLHGRWTTVQGAIRESGAAASVPARTRRRWLARLLSSAQGIVQALVTAGVPLAESAEARTRVELLAAMVREKLLSAGREMAELAGWVHRLVPGLRLA